MQVKHPKLSRDETKEVILSKADELFRRMGFHKTAVADVARELGMSPANIYKFFSSKEAIMDACALKYEVELESRLSEVARLELPALKKLEQVALEVYHSNLGYFENEKEIYKLVIAAIDRNWNSIHEFRNVFLRTIEKIVSDGVKSGEFKAVPISETANAINLSLQWITHALLFPELEHDQVEEQLAAQLRLIEKGLS